MTTLFDTKPVLRALAITTLTAASLVLAGCSLLPGANKPSDTATTGTDSDVFSIKIGDCLNDSTASGEVSSVPKVDCSVPHDSEAYDTGNLDDGDFPGTDAVKQAAEQICGPSFESFIGLGYDASAYDYSYYFPTDESWANGDREVVCVAFADDLSKVTGSLKGINA